MRGEFVARYICVDVPNDGVKYVPHLSGNKLRVYFTLKNVFFLLLKIKQHFFKLWLKRNVNEKNRWKRYNNRYCDSQGNLGMIETMVVHTFVLLCK